MTTSLPVVDLPPRRRRLRLVVVGVALLAVLTGWATPASSGPAHPVAEAPVHQEPAPPESDDSTTTSVTAPPDQNIIPEPNEGQAPQDAGDRGGWLQLAVLVLILAGVGIVAWRVVHEARRSRDRRDRDLSRLS